jgi:CrcB protein
MSTMRLGWVFLGGGLGSGARYLLGAFLLERFGAGFPFGTLAVNLIGSVLLAALVHVALATDSVSDELRIGLSAGFLGGFTTYSAFAYETITLLEQGRATAAAVYVGLTTLVATGAAFAGLAIGRAWSR